MSDAASTSEETFWALRSFLESLAVDGPAVLVFDDVQWAEPTFLDLLEYFSDTSRGRPIFLLCIARPELFDVRPAWSGGKVNATSVLLRPLTEADIRAWS